MIAQPDGSPKPHSGQIITPYLPASEADLLRASRDWYWSAPELADHALDNVVCRGDCYGGYRREWGTGEVLQTTHWTVADAACPDRRLAPPLDHARLADHFRGVGGLETRLGCHVSDADGECLWVVIDIDAHGPDDDLRANCRMASRVIAELTAMGLPFRVEDSDGCGGLHIWVLFGRRAPQAWAFRLGKFLVRDFADCGLAKSPESFPKAAKHSGKGCGGWVRLPGLHHKREHWSRIWSTAESRWLDGREAIESLLSFRGDPTIDLAPLVPADFVPASKRAGIAAIRLRPASFPAMADGFPAQVAGEPAEVARARSAIAWLGVDHFDAYKDWIDLGMALTALGDVGLELWDEISSDSHKYPGFADLEARWATLREADSPREIGLGSLYHWANEARWDGRYSFTTTSTGPRRRRSNVSDDPGRVVTRVMSDGWDDEFAGYVHALEDHPERKAELAVRLGLTSAGLATVSRSVEFGLKPTNQGRRADGSDGSLGPAWTYRESDGEGRTVGIRRLFVLPVSAQPELGCGSRSTKRADRPDRVTRISRRGLLTNLAEASHDAGHIYLVRGLLDFAAVASRHLPCVGLPTGQGDLDATLDDLALLLEGDDRPLIVPYGEGSPNPWADARAPARALGRELGKGILARSYPAPYVSISSYFTAPIINNQGDKR
jgi:hypothetical protein